jgi:hypothetical protein
MPDSNDLKSLDSQLKKTLISAESFKKGSSVDVSKSILKVQKTFGSLIGNVRQLVASVVSLEKIVNNNSRKITSLKNISKTQSTRISGENIGAKLPGSSSSNVEDSITKIAASVASIAEILAGRQKALNNAAAFDRRKAEQEKRGVAEGNLEKKFEGLKSAAEKVIAPVKSILDRIIDFFVTVFLGRVVYKLLEWFGDKKNADKVKAIGRFLGEMWPKLLALYLVFGSALGGFARGLIGLVVKGAVRLAAAAAGMAAKAGIKGAAGAAGFLGGKYGKLLGAGLEVAATVGTTMAVSKGIENFGGGEQKAQGLAGGGYVRPRFPAFSGGGLNFKGMLGGMGDMFGMLFAGGGGVSSGFVSGEKGVDKIPAMLSDGEFVMSAGAVQKYGVDTLEGMNAAGGGTNKPKMISGTTYAAGGGLIGQSSAAKEHFGPDAKRPPVETNFRFYFGPGATPTMSSQADMNKLADKITLEQRLKRIESQMQVQKALASGKGVNIRGASAGAQLGTGYGATYQGKKSIVIKGGAKNFSTGIGDKEITLAGQRYFAMKKGDDVIYTPQDKRDIGGGGMFQPGGMFGGPRMSARGDYAASKDKYYSSSDQKTYGNYNDALAARKSRMTSLASQQKLDRGGGGFLQPGGLFGGPRMSARVGYAASKGKYYSSSDQKTYANENDAKAARQSRMTSLASQQRLNKLSFAGANRSSRGVRIDAQDKERGEEFKERGGLMGQFGRLGQRMFGGAEAQKKLDMQQKASDARVKQAGAESIGRYYSSSDGKYYANFAAADKARIARQRQVNPPVKPAPKVVYSPAGGRQEANRKRSTGTGTPKFSASNPNGHRSKQETLGLMR